MQGTKKYFCSSQTMTSSVIHYSIEAQKIYLSHTATKTRENILFKYILSKKRLFAQAKVHASSDDVTVRAYSR